MPKIALTEIPKDNSMSATFEIVTPMFIGDANQQATAIRPTAIKGALRFWWRAMNGHLSTSELAKEEGRLFGSTDGAGVFSLSVTSNNTFQAHTDWPPKDANNSSSYMGYGLTGDQQNKHRNYIPAGIHFDVSLTFDPKAGTSDKALIQKALEAFGLFGSLGSRARRGFGSVQLINLNGNNFINITQPQIKQWLKYNLHSTLKKQDQIAFTAFSADSLS
ncbi:MAG: type III-B CRISPR module RAMP protein Cmr1 [Gammaproteobacteria bacterium]|nr:type III-B CRISPR module RAMP protein Cmr1 [Gammaproteobacteria bacterium]